MGDGTFGVGRSISRESIALMLYAYAKAEGYNTDFVKGASDGFAEPSAMLLLILTTAR